MPGLPSARSLIHAQFMGIMQVQRRREAMQCKQERMLALQRFWRSLKEAEGVPLSARALDGWRASVSGD
jgi:hypothetical protein